MIVFVKKLRLYKRALIVLWNLASPAEKLKRDEVQCASSR